MIEGRGWLRALVGYCRDHRALVAVTLLSGTAAALAAAAAPLVLRHVVDELTGSTPVSVWAAAWVLIGLAAARYVLNYLLETSAARLGLRIQYTLRRDMFSHLMRLPGTTQDTLDTGQVVSRSISDFGLITGVITFVPSVASSIVLFAVAVVAMLVLSPLLTLVALGVVPSFWLLGHRSRRALFPADWDASQRAAELVGDIEAAVSGVRVVKGFGQEQRELERIEGRARRLFASRMRALRLDAFYSPALAALPAVGQVGVLLLGGWLALHGRLSLGTFLAFTSYLALLVSPARQLAELLTVGPAAGAGVSRVVELLELPVVEDDPPDALDPQGGPAAVEFESVSFAYGEQDMLADVSFRVAPGETVALVGTSGSGKSTVLSLLERIYEPRTGEIRLDDVPLPRLARSGLRSVLGAVLETDVLFSGTIADNIAYGRPESAAAEIERVARIAAAHEFIAALPLGYATVIGERGLQLSGGQRQRLMVARALLASPSVLLLDDATSALDPRTELQVLRAIRDDAVRRTTLLVAHRRTTLELADRVVMLVDGRVAGQGSIAELRAGCPPFRAMFFPDDDAADDESVIGAASSARADSRAAARRMLDLLQSRSKGGAVSAGGAFAATAAATDELRERVAALPPVRDLPDLDDEDVRARDEHLSLRALLRPVRIALLIGLVLVAVSTTAGLAVPALIRTALDDGVATGSQRVLFTLGVIALVLVVVQWLVGRSAAIVTGRTGERLLYVLRVKSFANLQRLGLDFYERVQRGWILNRVTTDIDSLATFLQADLSVLLVAAVTVVGVLLALILLNAALSLVLVAMLPVAAGTTVLFRRRTAGIYRLTRDTVGDVNSDFMENLSGLRTVQLSGREQRNLARFLELTQVYTAARYRGRRAVGAYFPLVATLSGVAEALVLGFGGEQLRDGTLSAGALVAFFLYLDAFFSPVQDLSQVYDGYQQAAIGLGRIRELLAEPVSFAPAAAPVALERLHGELELHGVGFRYPGAAVDALTDVDLHIAASETVALVGETGAGKSTVVKLLMRFYDPGTGRVTVDGHDLRGLDLTCYRRRIGFVPQEQYLLAGTVAEAIAYARPDATRDEVIAAAVAAGAHETLLRLPGGYEHPVGEQGRNLSAGQRQLVALARAELVRPDVLVLDEATASLDLVTEAAIARRTASLAARRTTVIVAHRLTTAARADRIVVIGGGRVIEQGGHDDLLRSGGAYAALWESYADRAL